jgi:cell division protein FtsQ
MRRGLGLLISLALLGGVGVVVYALEIEEVRVSGLQTLSPRAVAEASGLRPGDRILWIRLNAAERRVEELPAVAQAVAQRSLPSTVVIRVEERRPLARLDGREGVATDATGTLFESADPGPLPVVAGWDGPGDPGQVLGPSLRHVLEAFTEFADSIRQATVRIEMEGGLTLWLADGTEVRFGPPDDLAAKAGAAQAVLEVNQPGELAYVDVRSPSVPVSAPREAVTEDEDTPEEQEEE